MSESFDLPSVDKVTVGAIGEPGARTFYLQARLDDQLVTLKLEKQQVDALATLLEELLEDLPGVGDLPTGKDLQLETPALPEWAVGAIQVAYDQGADRIVMLIEEIPTPQEGDEDEEIASLAELASEIYSAEGGVARLTITREQAAAIAQQGQEHVTAGRPRCPLCGFPINPDGHSCPKTNGHGSPAR